jgi:1-acyl-sn-glycerol-3-phosphate acyltransferase
VKLRVAPPRAATPARTVRLVATTGGFACPGSVWQNRGMLALRSALFNVVFYGFLITMMLVGLPTLLAGQPGVMRLANVWARGSLWLLRVICGTRIEFRGRHHIPAQPCILAAKHQSFLEIIALCSLFPNFSFVLKRELTFIPLFGWYLARSGQIAVDRSRGRAALTEVCRDAVEVLKEGRTLFIFPEGTRRPPEATPEYKSGIAYIYAETEAPCLPVAVNCGLFWPRRSFSRRPGIAVVEFLPVIPAGLPRQDFQTRMRDVIENASCALMAEAVEADPRLASLFPTGAVPVA